MTAHIVFGSDDGYIKYLSVTITSIIHGTQSQNIDNNMTDDGFIRGGAATQ